MAWTKEQEEAITKVGTNIIVSAGAGSGKTAVLTERTIRKLLNGGNIDRLLILTFTNAAAGEMRDRIRKALKKQNLKEQLDLIDSAYITTFDSYAMSVVKKYHEYIGISSNIQVMDKSIENLKTKELLDEIFESSYGNPNFDRLINDFCIKSDDNIKTVVKDISNKLNLLPNKKEYLDTYLDEHYSNKYIENKINEYVNVLIDTKESIKEEYYKLSTYVDNKYLDTYNLEPLLSSNTYEDIKANINIIGSPRKNKTFDESFKIYKENINNIVSKLKDLTRFETLDEIKSTYLSTKSYVQAIIDIIKKFDLEFNEYKNKYNLYTFIDIALMAINVIKNNPEVREEIKNSFDEIMVDEYQDTSDIQEEFISLISNNNVYMVGDIKQSIYRFRNANPTIFRNKYEDYSKGQGGIKIDLLKNFRSRKEVLDNINTIFNLIMDNNIGDADYKKSHQMNFGNTKYIDEWNTDQNYDMDILYYDKDFNKDYSKDEIEAFIIASDIREKIKEEYKIVDKETGKLRPCTYRDFSIIMDRGTSFDLYKKIFEYLGIPIVQIKNEALTAGYDIISLSNLINLIVKINLNELDDEFKYLYTSVARSYIYRLTDDEIFDIVVNNKYEDTELYKMCKNIDIYENSNLDLLNKVIEIFNLYEKLITIGNIKETMIKIDYLKDLSVNLSNIGYTPIEFAQYLNNMLELNDIEYSLNTDNSNSVKILNIHKSKGLEYSVCYFAGLSKKANDEDIKSRFLVSSDYDIIVPYSDGGINNTYLKDIYTYSKNKEDISERIRLFYVALTRTKEKMIILLPTEDKNISYTSLVPITTRLKYNRISDMLNSIKEVLKPYSKDVNLRDILITKDYEKVKEYNYKKEIDLSSIKIKKINNNIHYEEIINSRFSKTSKELITKDAYNNMNKGTKLHEIFETEDFENTNNDYVLRFLKHIDKNYTACFKEYEFIMTDNNEESHGFIDLILEYNNHIDLIDYKMKHIDDLEYINQLKGYKKYIESIGNKQVNIYLYSIVEDKLDQIKV